MILELSETYIFQVIHFNNTDELPAMIAKVMRAKISSKLIMREHLLSYLI